MKIGSNQFQEYLAPDESVVDVGSGTLIDDAYRAEGSVGVTDRRILFVTGDQGFTDIAHDTICAIRSRPRTTFTTRGLGYRLLAIVGVCVAVAAVGSAVVLSPGALASVLALLAVCGVIAAEYVRRYDVDLEWTAPKDTIGKLYEELDIDVPGRRERSANYVNVDTDHRLLLTVGLITLVTFLLLIAFTPGLLVFSLTLATLGGLAATDYAYRHKRDLDRLGASRRREREVTIQLVGGRIVKLRVDATERIDRELSRMACVNRRKTDGIELTEAPG